MYIILFNIIDNCLSVRCHNSRNFYDNKLKTFMQGGCLYLMVIGYVEKRFIDLRLVCKEFDSYGPGIKKFSSTAVEFDHLGLANYNMFDVQRLADELIPLFDECILDVVFAGDDDHMKMNVIWVLVNSCCISVIDIVET